MAANAEENRTAESLTAESQTEEQSLEQLPDSMWALKPWWCQPWSIVLTGMAIPTASWLLLHRVWVTLPTVAVVLVWWMLFLVLVPTQYAAAVREQALPR